MALRATLLVCLIVFGWQSAHAQPNTLDLLHIGREGANVVLEWSGGTNVRLQRSSHLTPAAWEDVPGTEGASGFTEAVAGASAFYRLARVCPEKIHLMLVMDVSGSLSAQDLADEIAAARYFLGRLTLAPGRDQVGLVTFCGCAVLNLGLGDGAAAQAALNSIASTCPGTVFHDPLQKAAARLMEGPPDAEAAQVIVLLTDGQVSYSTCAGETAQNTSTNRLLAKWQAQAARSAGIRIITVGFGAAARDPEARDFLTFDIASRPEDAHVAAGGSTLQLQGIFDAIASQLCRESSAPTANITAPVPNQTPPAQPSVTITASANDSDGAVVKVKFWVDGVLIGEDASAPYSVEWSNPGPGVHELRAEAIDDAGLVGRSDPVRIGIGPNAAPAVSAGPDQLVPLGVAVNLSGGATDDGLPLPSGLRLRWEWLGGGGNVSLSESNLAATTATFSQPGVYLFRLVADDGERASHDDVLVIADAAPTVGAWANPALVRLPAGLPTGTVATATAELVGVVTDTDGEPAGASFTKSWKVVSGPGAVRVAPSAEDPNRATATFYRAGEYRLRFSVSDSLLSASADVVVTVEQANERPRVEAGPAQTIQWPDLVYLPGSVTDDGLPDGYLEVNWAKVSGPGAVTFDDGGTSPEAMARFSAPGVYTLRLRATDVRNAQDFVSAEVVVSVETGDVRTFRDVDVASAGLAWMRNYGWGSIRLEGVSGTVKKAYLYWHGPTDLADPQANGRVLVNGRLVVGANIGISADNGWAYASEHTYTNSQAYRAEITELVAQQGNGEYFLERFAKGPAVNVNGASLIVLFDDGNADNDRDVIVVDGNDSNDPYEFLPDGSVHCLALQPDGKIVIGGAFSSFNVAGRNRIARLNPDGSLDLSFGPSSGADAPVHALAIDPNGKILIAGAFTQVEGQPRSRLARLNPDGSLDATFNPAVELNGDVHAMALDSEGGVVIGGDFTNANGQDRLVRLTGTGAIDTDFVTGLGVNGPVKAIVVLPTEDKILIGGRFQSVDGISRGGVALLGRDGSLDPAFNPPPVLFDVNALAVQSDGKILLGESLVFDNGESAALIRLHADGSRDTSFPSVVGTYQQGVSALALGPGPAGAEAIFAGGKFTSVVFSGQQWTRQQLARFDATGALDTDFDPKEGPSLASDPVEVRSIAVQSDGKVVVGGSFGAFNNRTADNLVRLNADGSVDESFRASDNNWHVMTPVVEYTAGSVEVQVSDGQHIVYEDAQVSYWADSSVYINGLLWLQPQAMPLCGGDPHPANVQLFQGSTVPGAHPRCSRWPADQPGGNLGLWDLVEKPLPVGLPTGRQRLVLSDDPREGDDALSLIAAVFKLAKGSALPALNPPVVRPEDAHPVARPDQFVMRRHLGAQVLEVLSNDTGQPDQPLVISSVSAPASGGSARVIYHGSALLYVPPNATNPAPAQDSFNYTIVDSRGNTATATVTLDLLEAPAVTKLSCGLAPTPGRLESTDATSITRGHGEYADYYAIEGRKGESVTVALHPLSGQVSWHLYLRDGFGWLVSAATHGPGSTDEAWDGRVSPQPTPSAQNGRGWNRALPGLNLSVTLEESGTYTLEVTSHGAGETGAYEMGLSCVPAGSVIQVLADGVSVVNGGQLDVGLETELDLQIANVGSEASGIVSMYATGVDGNPDALFSVTPSVLGSLASGERRAVRLSRNSAAGPAGLQRGELRVNELVGINVHDLFAIGLVAFRNPGTAPRVRILSPASPAVADYPAAVPVSIMAQPSNGGTISRVELFAKTSTERLRLGQAISAAAGQYTASLVSLPVGSYELSAVGTEELSGQMIGQGASAPISVTIADRSRNLPPVALDDVAVVRPNSLAYRIDALANDTDSNGDRLRVSAKTDGQLGTVSLLEGGRALAYTPQPNVYGYDQFSYTVTDGRGGTDRATVTVHIVDQTVALVLPQHGQSFSGTLGHLVVPIEARASTSHGAITRVEFYANNSKLGEQSALGSNSSYAFNWTPAQNGFYRLIVVAWDENGLNTTSEPITVGINVAGDPQPPVARIDNLLENQLVREGSFELRGAAYDPDRDVRYRLDLLKPTAEGLVLLANVTPTPWLSGVFDGYRAGPVQSDDSLALLDLTGRRNGVYVLELTVDNGLAQSRASVRFVLESQVKIGQLTFSEQDLQIPVGDLSLQVVRTYDSFNPAGGKLGPGWSLAFHDLEVELDEERRDAVDDDGTEFSLRTGGGRNVTLTLPDGRRATFVFSLKPGRSEESTPCFCYEARWTAPPGVFARLGALDNNRLSYLIGQSTIPPFWEAAGPGTPLDNFDFSGFVLTNIDGTEYHITRQLQGELELPPLGGLLQSVRPFGPPRLSQIRLRNGQRIEIEQPLAAGEGASHFRIRHLNAPVSHDSTGAESRSVLLTQDAQGRLTAIHDALSLASNPRGPAAVIYEYDTAGRLAQVRRLKERNGPPSYEQTTYVYGEPQHPHLITEIASLSGGVRRLLIYEAGRLVGIQTPGQDLDPFKEEVENLASLQHDTANRREIITDGLGHRTIHEYDPRGNVVRTINPLGETIARTYDDDGNVLSETDGLQRTTTYAYDTEGNRTRMTDPLGHTTTLQYEAFGRLTHTRDAKLNAADAPPETFTTRQQYEPDTGELLQSTDALGRTTQYSYAQGRLQTITDALGHRTVHHYYQNGAGGTLGDLRSVEVYQPNGDGLDKLLSEVDYTYDVNGNRRTETLYRNLSTVPSSDPLTTTYEYDGQNRLVRTYDPLYDPAKPNEHVSTVEYNELSKVRSRTDTQGRTAIYDYDTRGNLIQTQYPNDGQTPATVSRTVFDQNNRPLYTQDRTELHHLIHNPETDPLGNTLAPGTRTVYDPAGRVVRTERLAPFIVQIDTINGLPRTKAIEADGQFTVLSATTTRYNAAGQVIETADARGGLTSYDYDDAGRRLSVRDAVGHTSLYRYDPNGNQVSFTDALNRTTDYAYDELNRRTVVTFPAVSGQPRTTLQTDFDDLGRRVREIDQEGIVTLFEYDGLGRLTAVTNALSTAEEVITRYAYDGAGNQVEQTDANGRTTCFEHDPLNRRTKRILPLRNGQQEENTTYEIVNRRLVQTLTQFTGQRVRYEHDLLDRLVAKGSAPTPGQAFTPLVSFQYNARGQRTQMQDPSGTTTYDYDKPFQLDGHDHLITKATPQGTLTYDYDAHGNLISLFAGQGTTYQYDALSRLTNVIHVGQASSLSRYTYDPVGNLQTVTYPNSLAHDYSYDELNRLTHLNVTRGVEELASFLYTLRPNGQRSRVEERIGGIHRTVDYRYDSLYRLTNETMNGSAPVGSIHYMPLTGIQANTGYDKVGNRRSRTVSLTPEVSALPNGAQTYSYDLNDRLDNDPNPETASTLFDANGNTLLGEATLGQNPAQPDEYDFENRLVKRHLADGRTVEIIYNGDGHRVAKLIKQRDILLSTTQYLVDDRNPTGYAQVLVEETTIHDPPSTIYRSYSYGLDLISQTLSPSPLDARSSTSYYGYDGHGSVRFLSDGTVDGNGQPGPRFGQLTDTYTYDAFGILIAETHLGGVPTPNHYLYAGEQRDEDLGLYYNRARYLNANTGRFWTRDTFEGRQTDPLSLHKYLYGHANPVNGVDPSGHEFNLTAMQWVTAVSITINSVSAGINLRKGNYGAATIDLVGAGLGAFGLFGGPPSALFPRLASAGGIGSATLSSAQLAKLWQSVLAGASLISQGVAVGELTIAMSSTDSPGSGSTGSSSSSSSSDELDWSIVSSEGETRAEHVALHAANDLQKKLHGVFYGNPVEVIKEAWQIKKASNIQPINPGGSADIYVIPKANAGYQGGYAGQGQNLDKVVIITQKGSRRLFTGYPAGAGPGN